MAEKKKSEDKYAKTRVTTPKFRVSYPAVFTPKTFKDAKGNETAPRYQVTMLFASDTDLSSLKKAVFAAKVAKWGPNKEKWPKGMRSPFRDGSEKNDTEGYGEGIIFVTASGDRKPGLVSQKLKKIEREEDFYAGCWARAEVVAFAYETMGNKGVSFGLRNIQKMGDDESFSGQRAAEDVFDKVDGGSDDEDNYEDDDEEETEETDEEEDEEEEDEPAPKKKKKKAGGF